MANGLFGLLGSRPPGGAPVGAGGRGPFPSPRGGARVGPAGPTRGPSFPPRAAGGRPPFLGQRLAEGGEVEDPELEESEHEVTPELKLAAYELLECLDNHSYSDDKGGRAEALAKHLLAFFHLAEEMPHEEGPHTAEEPGEYEGEE